MGALTSIFLESNGYKRTLAIIFLLAGMVADAIPALTPYKPVLEAIGAALGVTGIVHAGAVSK